MFVAKDGNKALYTVDDRRQNLYTKVGLDQIKQQARSVACMIHPYFIEPVGNDSYALKLHTPTLGFARNMKDDQAFINEPVPGFGTVFLVSDRLALTAGHCVANKSNELDHERNRDMYIVFDFQMEGDNQCKRTFPSDTVYRIKKIVGFCMANQNGKITDWALVKLDRKVVGSTPLKVNFSGNLAPKTQLDMLGHPSGLPQKYTDGAEIKSIKPGHFEADLDAFAGNSGSPVFDKITREVIGILVRGLTDYETVNDKGQSKRQAYHVTESDIALRGYENCQKVSEIAIFCQKYILASSGERDYQYQLGLHYAQNVNKMFSWMHKAAQQGHVEAQAKVNELSMIQLVVSQNALNGQLAKGLNFEIICTTQECVANGKIVYVQKKLGSFNIGREAYNTCSSCNRTIHKINNLVFWDCQFTITGKASDSNAIKHNGQIKTSKYLAFNLNRNISWIYLESETK